MPLDKAEAFAFLRMMSDLDLLGPFLGMAGKAAEVSAREPGTRFLEDANLALAKLDLDEISELVEAANPLISYLISQPEMVRRIMGTAIAQRRLRAFQATTVAT